MSEVKTYKIETLQDLVALDEEQLDRLIPDLKIWINLRKRNRELAAMGIYMQPYMMWKDDGETGLKEVTVTFQQKGNQND